MSSEASEALILEVERLLGLPVAARELEGVYANESQLKLLKKKVRASRGLQPAGVGKFVADFSGSGSRLLHLTEKLEIKSDD
jgi:hypothetical protein